MAVKPQFTATEEFHLHELVYRTMVGAETVVEAARQIGVSRNYAHGLLKRAREAELIEVTLRLDPTPVQDLEQRLREEFRPFGIREVRVLPSAPDDSTIDSTAHRNYLHRSLASLAVRYIADLDVAPGSHFCVSGGQLLLEVAERFQLPASDLVARPLAIRPSWRPVITVDAVAVLHLLQARLGSASGRLRTLWPQVLPGEDMKKAHRRPEVSVTFGKAARQPAFCLMNIGRIEPETPSRTVIDTYGYVAAQAECLYYREHAERLRSEPGLIYEPIDSKYYEMAYAAVSKSGIVGSFNWYGLDKHGAVVDNSIATVALAFHPMEFRTWAESGNTEVIALAHGSKWATPTLAAIRGRYLTTLIVDTALGASLLPSEKLPPMYRATRKSP